MNEISKDVRFITFPRTIPPDTVALNTVEVFKKYIDKISTVGLDKGLTSDQVLEVVAYDLEKIGFLVEKGKKHDQKIHRPVLFGENGKPTVKYEIDAYHPAEKTSLEIEAGRAWKGNAIYRDLIINLLIIDVDHLIVAVPLTYKYNANEKGMINRDYENCKHLIDDLYSQTRFKMPYNLTLIGY